MQGFTKLCPIISVMLTLPTQNHNPELGPAPAGSIQFVCALLFSSLVLKEQVRPFGRAVKGAGVEGLPVAHSATYFAFSETYINDDPITVKQRPTTSKWPAAAACPQRAPRKSWCSRLLIALPLLSCHVIPAAAPCNMLTHYQVTIYSILSTALIIGGSVLLVIFGNHQSEAFTVQQLMALYAKWVLHEGAGHFGSWS